MGCKREILHSVKKTKNQAKNKTYALANDISFRKITIMRMGGHLLCRGYLSGRPPRMPSKAISFPWENIEYYLPITSAGLYRFLIKITTGG